MKSEKVFVRFFQAGLKINSSGSYTDGDKISNITIEDVATFQPHWSLRIEVSEDAKNVGGCSIFGSGFGNYDQDIVIKQYYR